MNADDQKHESLSLQTLKHAEVTCLLSELRQSDFLPIFTGKLTLSTEALALRRAPYAFASTPPLTRSACNSLPRA